MKIKFKGGDFMPEKEMIKVSVEEFSRLQNYMLASEKDSDSYKLMKDRYVKLKVILNSCNYSEPQATDMPAKLSFVQKGTFVCG